MFGPSGSLSGLISGGVGVGATDSFAVADGSQTVVFLPDADESTGLQTIAGRTIHYAGMDSTTVLEGTDVRRTIHGSDFNDDIVLEADTAGRMKVTLAGKMFRHANGQQESGSYSFNNPTQSLTIKAHGGADTITVRSVDSGFAAQLRLYGDKPGAPPIGTHILSGSDVVRFEGDTLTHGGYLEAFADRIYVNSGVTLSTLTDQNDLATGSDIVFRARRISTTEFENLLPSGKVSKRVAIGIGAGAKLLASSMYLVAQAEDRSLATQLGLTTLQPEYMALDLATSLLTDLVSLPVKVLLKPSEANVTIGRRLSCGPTTWSASMRPPAQTRARVGHQPALQLRLFPGRCRGDDRRSRRR